MLTTLTEGGARQRIGLDVAAIAAPTALEDRMQSVAVLLSIYNGKNYLTQQLHSFAGQTWGQWCLYWRDDGSSDESVKLVDAFATGAGFGHCIRNEEAGHFGASGSFLVLLRMAVAGDAAFFAFSDQDDIWLPDKLTNGVAALGKISSNRPALYFCRRMGIDELGAPVGQQVRLPRTGLGLRNALTQNMIPGCCMILNRAAAELIVRSPMPESAWHDWWSYIVVASCDGVIIPGTSTDILYRRHGGNLVGEDLDYPGRRIKRWLDERASYYALFWRHVTGLLAWNGPLSQEARTLLKVIGQVQHSGLPARVTALAVSGLTRQTLLETQIFRLGFLLS